MLLTCPSHRRPFVLFMSFLSEWPHHPLPGPSQEAWRSVSLPAAPKWPLPCAVLDSESGFPPCLPHVCHLHSQMFNCELPACTPAKQVGLTPASSVLCMRNLIVCDRLLTMEEKNPWIGLNALCLDFINQRGCCKINWRINCNLTLRQRDSTPWNTVLHACRM